MIAPANLEILPIGTRVRLGMRNDSNAINGRIIQAAIHSDYTVSYLIEWWDGESRCCESMTAELFFLASDVELVTIGFLAPKEGSR